MRNAVALSLLLLGAAARAEEGYAFFLGDERIYPSIVSLEGTPDRPRAGDLAEIKDVWITLGEPGTYRFRRDENRTFLVGAAGAETLVAATMSLDLSREEVRRLRGLRIGHWDDAMKDLADAIDPATTCVTLRTGGPIAALPATLEHLCLDSPWDSPFPLTAAVGRFRSLRVLVANGASVEDAYGFKDLGDLQFLALEEAKGVRDVGFVARMPKLRVLGIGETEVSDLGPLGGHPSLAYVHASGRSIERLPEAPMPALREMVAYGARWSDEAHAAFVRRNPRCKLTDRWEPALREALSTCDRIRVRSGGTCCRSPEIEETLLEVRDAEEIREAIAGIAIQNLPSMGVCGCCGFPTFEFYAGERLLETVGFHHEQNLRWPGGPWPGDAALVEESAQHLKRWLAKHGLADLDAAELHYAVLSARARDYERVLEQHAGKVSGAATPEAKAAVLKAVSDVERERIALWLRVLGCHEGGWDRATELDAVVLGLLAEVPAETLAAALPSVHAGRDGAARWLLGEERWTVLPAEALAAALPEIARRGLAHPNVYSRRRAVLALGAIGSPEAIAALRAFVKGEIEPRRASRLDKYELPGTPVARADPEELLGASERAVAAFLLLRLRDVECLAEIRELLAGAEGADADLVRAGLKLVE